MIVQYNLKQADVVNKNIYFVTADKLGDSG